jgi:trehalose/maltose hydrolase-like predicted phosphorylase
MITNLDPTVQTPALLSNGLFGIRIDSDGTGRGNTFFDIANYQPGGEEKLVGAPNPLDLQFFVEGVRLDPKKGADFTSTLDLKTGMWIQSWTQSASGNLTVVTVQTRIDARDRLLQQIWWVTPSKDAELTVVTNHRLKDHKTASEPLAGQTASSTFATGRTQWIIDDTVDNKSAGTWSEREWEGNVDSDPSFTYTRWVREISVPKGIEPEPLIWQSDIEIDGPVEDQQFIRSALYYLRSSIHPEGKMSVSPMGLSSEIYNGHVFWDADIWVFPALALIDPERARAIPEYRLRNLQSARSNFGDWVVTGRQIGDGKKLTKPEDEGRSVVIEGGAKFPWESSVSGKETVPGPSRFQDHISGSVAWTVSQASDLGLVDPAQAKELKNEVREFFRFRTTQDGSGVGQIKGTMSPDENHIGDNDLYTNVLAQWATGDPYKLPKDSQTFLTYDHDALRGYKQAAAVLSIWPLQYPPAEAQAKRMMERYAGKTSKNGPAMSDSVHALIWARLGDREAAYDAWHASWKPFVKPPFLLFSEKRNSSRTYFTTGAAGSLNAVLYGFAGLRIDDKKAPNAQWSMTLKNGKVLSIAPNLPREWKKLTLKNLTILGKKTTFVIEGDKVRVVAGG